MAHHQNMQIQLIKHTLHFHLKQITQYHEYVCIHEKVWWG